MVGLLTAEAGLRVEGVSAVLTRKGTV